MINEVNSLWIHIKSTEYDTESVIADILDSDDEDMCGSTSL